MDIYQISKRETYSGIDCDAPIDVKTYRYNENYCSPHAANPTEYYETTVCEEIQGTEYKTTYRFNKDNLCTYVYSYEDGKKVREQATLYNVYDMPRKVTTKYLGEGKEVSAVELYTHNSHGNTLTYISPNGGGNTTNTKYRTTYTYGSYQLPLTVSYQQDAKTKVVITNTLTPKKDNIATTVTKVNNVTVAKTEYEYHNSHQQ